MNRTVLFTLVIATTFSCGKEEPITGLKHNEPSLPAEFAEASDHLDEEFVREYGESVRRGLSSMGDPYESPNWKVSFQPEGWDDPGNRQLLMPATAVVTNKNTEVSTAVPFTRFAPLFMTKEEPIRHTKETFGSELFVLWILTN